jgi:hypothetical protein
VDYFNSDSSFEKVMSEGIRLLKGRGWRVVSLASVTGTGSDT